MKGKIVELKIFSLLNLFIKNDFLNCFVSIFKKLLDSVIYAVSILVISKFINSIIQMSYKETSIVNVLAWLIMMMLIFAYRYISRDIDSLFKVILENNLRTKLGGTILEKLGNASCKNVESEEFLKAIEYFKDIPEKKLSNIYMKFLTLISSILEFVIILIIIMKINKLLSFIEFVVMALAVALIIWSTKKEDEKKYNINKYLDEVKKINNILKVDEKLQDREIFSYIDIVNSKVREQLKCKDKLEFDLNLKNNLICKIGSIACFISIIVSSLNLLPIVRNDTISVGFFIAVNIVLAINVKEISTNLFRYLNKKQLLIELIECLDIVMSFEKREDGQTVQINKIEFRNVSFKDPKKKIYILKDVSFSLESGKKYAFIGKSKEELSLLFKALVGIYKEFEGDILVNGISIKELKKNDLINDTSISFENYNKYPISIKENLYLESNKDNNSELLNKVIKEFELYNFLTSLPMGINTLLDEIDVEDNIWKRLNLARLSMSESNLKIIQCASSIKEKKEILNLYKTFNDINNEKIVVYISQSESVFDIVDSVIRINDVSVLEEKNRIENKCKA